VSEMPDGSFAELAAASGTMAGERGVAAYLERWLAHVRGRVRTVTYEGYVSLLEHHALPRIGHLQLSELTETNSDGTQRITRMKYPLDYPAAPGTSDPAAAALTGMQDAHIHNAVVERWVIERAGGVAKIVAATLTTFKQFATGQYLPHQRFVLNSPSAVQ